MNRLIYPPLLTLLLLSPPSLAEWHVERTPDPESGVDRCLLLSSEQRLFDGYIDTPIQLRIDRQQLLIVTDSNIDPAYPDQGIQVDDNPRLLADELPYRATMARFESSHAALIGQFVRGYRAVVSLGFWPTWPITETRSATFDLRGFTKAYESLTTCEARDKSADSNADPDSL